jgi:hypothetical protein
VKFPRWYGGESHADRAGTLEDLLPCSEAWSCVGTTGDCLVLSGGAQQTRNNKLRCLGGESQLLQPLYSCFAFSRSLAYMANLFWLCVCKYKPLPGQQYYSMIQGDSNMTGTCAACLHTNQSRSYLNHLVYCFEIHIDLIVKA